MIGLYIEPEAEEELEVSRDTANLSGTPRAACNRAILLTARGLLGLAQCRRRVALLRLSRRHEQ